MFETEAIRQNYELGVLVGEAREQKRIIKLLEKHLIWSYDIGLGYKLGSQIDLDDLFELIKHKGEK